MGALALSGLAFPPGALQTEQSDPVGAAAPRVAPLIAGPGQSSGTPPPLQEARRTDAPRSRLLFRRRPSCYLERAATKQDQRLLNHQPTSVQRQLHVTRPTRPAPRPGGCSASATCGNAHQPWPPILPSRNANQATKLIVAEGFRLNHEKVAVEAVSPPITYVNVYRLPAYLPDDVLTNVLQQYGKVRGVSFATVPSRQNKLNGVRVLKMEMCKPVPNFTTIQGHRVMCEYRGMGRVCARCGDDGHMATACTNPYCKRCGVFGHDTEGCSEECKRCGGRHGTRECFRRRSYVAAARGFPPASETAPARDQSSGQASPTGSMGMSGLHVLKPRPPPSTPRKAPDYWDGDKTTENDAMSAATSSSVPRADQRACAKNSASATSDSDITAISPSDASSAKPSPNSSLAPHSSSDEQEVPTTGANLDGVESTSPLANDESNASASHGGRPRPKPSGACDQQDGEHGFDRGHIAART
ncbi:hypothetical protein HPB52_004216 [Rhipicephalus sanguineus]|uniref:CCHC-type domain-containing protein n=1 Tax=Rhipicephalus sanguineus TaxID=34632 RepID=A0A9D4Q4I7_RHISA|nr:hypothetical protein HPB52_004216 [Rhipicephalus sanguineus]